MNVNEAGDDVISIASSIPSPSSTRPAFSSETKVARKIRKDGRFPLMLKITVTEVSVLRLINPVRKSPSARKRRCRRLAERSAHGGRRQAMDRRLLRLGARCSWAPVFSTASALTRCRPATEERLRAGNDVCRASQGRRARTSAAQVAAIEHLERRLDTVCRIEQESDLRAAQNPVREIPFGRAYGCDADPALKTGIITPYQRQMSIARSNQPLLRRRRACRSPLRATDEVFRRTPGSRESLQSRRLRPCSWLEALKEVRKVMMRVCPISILS